MPPRLPLPVASLAAHSIEVSGQTIARTIAGVGTLVMEYARNVRVNADATLAISRRVSEMASVVAETTTQNDDLGDFNGEKKAALANFQRSLQEIEDTLREQAGRSYLAQLLHQKAFSDNLTALSERFNNAFRVLMVQMDITNTAMAIKLSSRVKDLANRQLPEQPRKNDTAATAARIPPRPQLHFGRQSETESVVRTVDVSTPARVAILGGPGLGKTTLAVAVLHDPAVVARFGAKRFFVACDAAESQSSCLHTIAQAFGIMVRDPKVARQRLIDAIGGAPALLVLDNFESAWEHSAQRRDAEDVLQFLDALPHLSLILTLRGAERPQGVRWTRPFLAPLEPLGRMAALQTFLTIADVQDSDAALHALLAHTGNIPLAVVLMANLAQSESPESLLRRWNEVHTAMLVRGAHPAPHRLDSLDISISVSLQSPRLQAAPAAQTLLAVLSLLPHGVVDTDLQLWGMAQSALAVSVLLQSALAFRREGRVCVLAPIRSFMLAQHPPSLGDTAPVYNHYFALAEHASQAAHFAFDAAVYASIAPELTNIDFVLRYALEHNQGEPTAAIKSVVSLCILYAQNGVGPGPALLPLALSAAQHLKLDALRADLLLQWGRISSNTSFPGDPAALYREARDIYAQLEPEQTEGLINSSLLAARYLPASDALVEVRRLFDLAQSRSNTRQTARAAYEIGVALRRNGRPVEAIAQFEEVVRILQTAENAAQRPDYAVGLSKYMIGELHMALGNLPGAVSMYEAALPDLEAAAFAYGVSIVRTQLAQLLLAQGRVREAIAHAEQGLAVHHSAGVRSYVRCVLILAEAHALVGAEDAAATLIERVERIRLAGGLSLHQESEVLQVRGCMALSRGDWMEARILLVAARAKIRGRDVVRSQESMMQVEAIILQSLAEVEHADPDGDPEQAATFAITAAVLGRKTDRAVRKVVSLLELAEIVDDEHAPRLLLAVMLPLQRMGIGYGLAMALLRSAKIAVGHGERELGRQRARNSLKFFGDMEVDWRIPYARQIAEDET